MITVEYNIIQRYTNNAAHMQASMCIIGAHWHGKEAHSLKISAEIKVNRYPRWKERRVNGRQAGVGDTELWKFEE